MLTQFPTQVVDGLLLPRLDRLPSCCCAQEPLLIHLLVTAHRAHKPDERPTK
ncbi:mCG140570 [Mus musculus]|nr:mCG140570 [Mus musculus]